MLKMKALAVAICAGAAAMSAGPAAAEEWSPAGAAYNTAKWHVKQAAKATLDFVIPSAQASCRPSHGRGSRLKGNNGFGNGGRDDVPGRSRH